MKVQNSLRGNATVSGIVGVALSLPPHTATQLTQARRDVGDAGAELIPPHITLVPPVRVGSNHLDDAYAHCEQVAARTSPFEVHLRGTGTFRPVTQVVFIAVVAGIAGCEKLHQQLAIGPLAVHSAYPYHPHITIAHDVSDAALDAAYEEYASFDSTFLVTEFTLYTHTTNGQWNPTRSFPLALQQ